MNDGFGRIIFIIVLIIGGIAVSVLYYGAIAFVILWLLQHFGVIKLLGVLS